MIEKSKDSSPNNWLNSIILEDRKKRDLFLDETNSNHIMTRPIWKLMNKTRMFEESQCGLLDNALWLEDRVVNLPSSVRIQ